MIPFHHLISSPQPPAVPDDAPYKWREAPQYLADTQLKTALEIGMVLRQPVLLSGEPGTGKTSAAYWAAWRMGLSPEDLIHVQVRSEDTASALRYEFDAIRYLRESQEAAARQEVFDSNRERFIRKGPLWTAFEAARTRPMVLLLDGVDNAPREFVRDLLRELEGFEFEVPDLVDDRDRPQVVSARGGDGAGSLLVVLTSDGERPLPSAVLRRCIHHHLSFQQSGLLDVVLHRIASGDLEMTPTLAEPAVEHFHALRSVVGLRHRPTLAELLVWLRVLALSGDMEADTLRGLALHELPYLGALLKDPDDHLLVANLAP